MQASAKSRAKSQQCKSTFMPAKKNILFEICDFEFFLILEVHYLKRWWQFFNLSNIKLQQVLITIVKLWSCWVLFIR
jgi:hypothetical protein